MKNLEILSKLGSFYAEHQDKELLDESIESYKYVVSSLYLELFQLGLSTSPFDIAIGHVVDWVKFSTSDITPSRGPSYEVSLSPGAGQYFSCGSDVSLQIDPKSFSVNCWLKWGTYPELSSTEMIFLESSSTHSISLTSTNYISDIAGVYSLDFNMMVAEPSGYISKTFKIKPAPLAGKMMSCSLRGNSIGSFSFFVNGVSLGVDSESSSGTVSYTSLSNSALYLGYQLYPIQSNFIVDEFQLWSSPLSDSEITSFYNGGTGVYGSSDARLKVGYHFDEGSGRTISDYSGNNNTGTWVSSDVPTWFVGEVANPTITYSLPLDLDYISIPTLQDVVNEPLIVLAEDIDYTIGDQEINFGTKPPVSDYLWAFRARINRYDLFYLYGAMLGLTKESDSETYLFKIQALWTILKQGATRRNIKVATYVFFNLPFSFEDGLITSRTGDELIIKGITERTYTKPTGLVWEVNTGDRVTKYQPLSSGIEIYDYYSDPLFVYKIAPEDFDKYLEGGSIELAIDLLRSSMFAVGVHPSAYTIFSKDQLLAFLRRIKPAYSNVEVIGSLSSSDVLVFTDTYSQAIYMDLSAYVGQNPKTSYSQETSLNYESMCLYDVMTYTTSGATPPSTPEDLEVVYVEP